VKIAVCNLNNMAISYKTPKKTASEQLSLLEQERDNLIETLHDMVSAKIYPLSDVLQLEIDIYSDGGNNFELKGSRNWVIPIVKTDFKFKMNIEASFVDNYQASVLVSITKNFWVYAHFSNEVDSKGIVTLYYLDVKGTPTKPLKEAIDGQALEIALAAIRPLMKAKFIKGTQEILWKQLPIKVAVRVPKSA
jgi:hypothetical protein